MENADVGRKALKIVSELDSDPEIARDTLKLVIRTYEAYNGNAGRFKGLPAKAAGVAMLLAGVMVWQIGVDVRVPKASTGHPFVWGEARFASNRINPGEPLVVISSHKYLQACDWEIKREFLRPDRHLIAVTTENLPAIAAEPEFHHMRNPIPVPENLKPGEYIFKAELHGLCPDGRFDLKDLFEQNFSIREPKSNPQD